MLEEIQNLLKSAPAPSPWYLRIVRPQIQTRFGMATWTGLPSDSKVALKTQKGENLAVVGMYTWVGHLENGLILTYKQRPEKIAKRDFISPTPPVKLNLYDPNRFEPIDSSSLASKEVDEKNMDFYQEGGLLASCEIPSHVSEQVRSFQFPVEFGAICEILILCQSSPNINDGTSLGLMIASPSQGTYEIFPQDWFNQGNYDFGYQWVTRVVRNPRSGQIFGDGMRLRIFSLDASCRKVENWF